MSRTLDDSQTAPRTDEDIVMNALQHREPNVTIHTDEAIQAFTRIIIAFNQRSTKAVSNTKTAPEDIEKLARRICATLQMEGDWPWEYVMTEIRDWLGTGGERRWPENCDWPQDRDLRSSMIQASMTLAI